MKEQIMEQFKRVYGVGKIGIGNFKNLYEDFRLPSKGWKEISSGPEGNFDYIHNDGKNYYSFVIDPYYSSEEILVFETFGKKNYEELVDMTHLFFRIQILHEVEEKTCWECGQKFKFLDIAKDENLNSKKNFERAISYWEDSYCGC